jgi:predicted TIM-barrel fold metal-dependent hydrolase
MQSNRREFTRLSAGLIGTACATGLIEHFSARPAEAQQGDAAQKGNEMLIIDTHQHLWNLKQLKLPWLETAPEILKHDYRPQEYAEATAGLKIKAVYMEVDVATSDHDKEAEYVIGLCKSGKEPTIGAVIGGRPAAPDFVAYLERHKVGGYVKGVRQVLHNPDTPRGRCLEPDFVKGVQALGKHGLSFDLCMRPQELRDGLKLSELCPETRFVVDHCGNADPKAFDAKLAGDAKPAHAVDPWRKDMEALAKRDNVICKISGIVASAPPGWRAEHLAPAVNHCLDVFGPDRVIFGGDWPVCLLGSPLSGWVKALREIVSNRSPQDQRKLWSENAIKFYRLNLS